MAAILCNIIDKIIMNDVSITQSLLSRSIQLYVDCPQLRHVTYDG